MSYKGALAANTVAAAQRCFSRTHILYLKFLISQGGANRLVKCIQLSTALDVKRELRVEQMPRQVAHQTSAVIASFIHCRKKRETM